MSLTHRCQRYYYRYSLSLNKGPKSARLLKTCLLIFLGFLLMNLINAILFTSILIFQENDSEPDYDFDTRPFYRIIEEKKRFDESANYLIVSNFLQYRANLTKNADLLGLNLHTTIENLHLFATHVNVWDGPISLSLYVKGSRASDDVDYAAIWFRCHRKSLKMLNVHLVMSTKAYQTSISNQRHQHSVKYAVHCQQLTYINHTDETDSTPYPSNLLRNVARTGMPLSTIQYILNLDIDVFPSADLFHHLVTFYTQSETDELFNRTVYVIPTFEIHRDTVQRAIPIPQNKRELILLWNDNQVQPFENSVCPTCQAATNYEAWRQETKNERILPLFRPHYAQPWKPFYIGPKYVPMFDSRFKAHAHARISQVRLLYSLQ